MPVIFEVYLLHQVTDVKYIYPQSILDDHQISSYSCPILKQPKIQMLRSKKALENSMECGLGNCCEKGTSCPIALLEMLLHIQEESWRESY